MATATTKKKSVEQFVANEFEQEMIWNAMELRRKFYDKFLVDERRDLYAECGWPKELKVREHYKPFYDRFSIAARVVQLFPLECWLVQPEIYEDEDESVKTDFELAYKQASQSLSGDNWMESNDEESNPILETLARLDVLCGIGHYGVILIGIDDGLELDQPAQFYNSKEATSGKKRVNFASKISGTLAEYDRPIFTTNETTDSGTPFSQEELGNDEKSVEREIEDRIVETKRKLIYLKPFDESLVKIVSRDNDRTSVRYNQPILYEITVNDPELNQQGLGVDTGTVRVHWTRVHHQVDNLGSSDTEGMPRMQQCFNNLADLFKLYGGSAEMYWQGAFPGLSLESNPQMGPDIQLTDEDKADMRNTMENVRNGLQRYWLMLGMQTKTIAPTVVDPSAQIKVQIEAICVMLGCPVRIFMGSERGELASSQDANAWGDRVAARQKKHLSQRMLGPFFNRLIQLGVLPIPESGKFYISWPDLTKMNEEQKANLALIRTQAMQAYVSGGIEALMQPLDYFTKELGYSQEEALSIIESTVTHLQDSYPDTADTSVQPGHAPAPPKQEPPPGLPIKLKDGEKLVSHDGNPLFNRLEEDEIEDLHISTKMRISTMYDVQGNLVPVEKMIANYASQQDVFESILDKYLTNAEQVANYNPSQPRDARGRWGAGGSSGGGGGSVTPEKVQQSSTILETPTPLSQSEARVKEFAQSEEAVFGKSAADGDRIEVYSKKDGSHVSSYIKDGNSFKSEYETRQDRSPFKSAEELRGLTTGEGDMAFGLRNHTLMHGSSEQIGKRFEKATPVNPEGKFAHEQWGTKFDHEGIATEYHPERQALHNAMIRETFEGVTPQKNPEFVLMGGGPASGKTSVNKAGLVKKPPNAAEINADDIKGKIPEYNRMIAKGDIGAAGFAHEESSFVAKKMLDEGSARKANYILDGTGDGGLKSLQSKVDQAKASGHKVSAEYVTIPTVEAVKRAEDRGRKSGRVVNTQVIEKTHADVSRTFPKAVEAGLLPDVRLWNNDVPQGTKPKLIFEVVNGKRVVHDQTAYQAFLDKAN